MAATFPPGVDLTADWGPELARICIAFAILTTFVVAVRLISRKTQHADWIVADYLIIVAPVGCWGETSSVLYGKPTYCHLRCSPVVVVRIRSFIPGVEVYGFGNHVEEVIGLENIIGILKFGRPYRFIGLQVLVTILLDHLFVGDIQ